MKSILLLILIAMVGCVDEPGLVEQVGAFSITFVGGPELGTDEQPLEFSAQEDLTFMIDVEALRNDRPELLYTTYNGSAVLTVQPTGKTVKLPHDINFVEGRAQNVEVKISGAYGIVRLVVTDKGYVKAENAGEAVCNDGLDDDFDGYVDTPIDRGCYYANDQTEDGGSGATGASEPIFFASPRMADIQRPGKDGDKSALLGSRVKVDEGFMLITRVSTDGLYITDFDGARWDDTVDQFVMTAEEASYRSIFAFNFSTPLNMHEGDCLVQLDGTVEEFFGYTELGKPTWKKGDYEFCAAKARSAGLSGCPVTAQEDLELAKACRLAMEARANEPVDVTLLMIKGEGGTEHSAWDKNYLAPERFESALVQLSNVRMFTELRACDLNGDGVVDFGSKEEKDCSNDCGDDKQCIVAETYHQYKQWTVHFADGAGVEREVSVVSQGAMKDFDPLQASAEGGAEGKLLSKVVGTMRNLSFGRPQWILEPRRQADCPDCKN